MNTQEKTYSDPIAEWDKQIDTMKAAGKTQADAVRAIATKDPGLHRQYLAAYNEQHGRTSRRY